MKQETVKHLADGAVVSAGGMGISSYMGWFSFINENAPGIGVIISLIALIVGIGFNVYNSSKLTQTDKNKAEIDTIKDTLNKDK